eukprot:6020486-Pleurochrysis_carterae.AAC.4
MPLRDPHAGICEIALSLPRFWIEPAIASLCFGLWTHCFRAAEGHYALLWRSWLKPPHLMLSLLVYWAGVCIWVAVVPPPPSIPHGCPSDAESSLQLAIEVCAGIIAYDFIFFWIHLSMHAMPRTIGWMTNHTRHHELDATVLNGHAVHVSAGRVVHHSFVDGRGQHHGAATHAVRVGKKQAGEVDTQRRGDVLIDGSTYKCCHSKDSSTLICGCSRSPSASYPPWPSLPTIFWLPRLCSPLIPEMAFRLPLEIKQHCFEEAASDPSSAVAEDLYRGLHRSQQAVMLRGGL